MKIAYPGTRRQTRPIRVSQHRGNQCGLAASIGATQGDPFTRLDSQPNVVSQVMLAMSQMQIIYGNQVLSGHRR